MTMVDTNDDFFPLNLTADRFCEVLNMAVEHFAPVKYMLQNAIEAKQVLSMQH